MAKIKLFTHVINVLAVRFAITPGAIRNIRSLRKGKKTQNGGLEVKNRKGVYN